MPISHLIWIVLLLNAGCDHENRVAVVPPAAATACSGNANGVWYGPAGAKVTLGADCAIRFESVPFCRSEGTYRALMGTTGVTTVTIETREGEKVGCPAPSRFQCAFIAAGGLTLNCGGGAIAYTKMP